MCSTYISRIIHPNYISHLLSLTPYNSCSSWVVRGYMLRLSCTTTTTMHKRLKSKKSIFLTFIFFKIVLNEVAYKATNSKFFIILHTDYLLLWFYLFFSSLWSCVVLCPFASRFYEAETPLKSRTWAFFYGILNQIVKQR